MSQSSKVQTARGLPGGKGMLKFLIDQHIGIYLVYLELFLYIKFAGHSYNILLHSFTPYNCAITPDE